MPCFGNVEKKLENYFENRKIVNFDTRTIYEKASMVAKFLRRWMTYGPCYALPLAVRANLFALLCGPLLKNVKITIFYLILAF